jgi:glutamate transport system permease protein
MAASVLFDSPGPATRRRYRLYNLGFAVVLLAVLAWVGYKLNAAGQFDPEIYRKLSQPNIWTALLDGLVATLEAAGLAILLAVVVGFLLAVGRLSDHAWISWPSRLVIEFFRAVPVLLLMIFLYAVTGGHGIDTDTRAFFAVVGGLVLYNGSVLAEVFRAGINAVPKGQSEAAYAIGMRKTQVMTLILTPQAVRYMLPAIISQCVVALKDTSLGFIVAYLELLRQGKLIAEYVNNYLATYVLIALLYIVLNSLVSALAGLLEQRLSRGAKATQSSARPAAAGGAAA